MTQHALDERDACLHVEAMQRDQRRLSFLLTAIALPLQPYTVSAYFRNKTYVVSPTGPEAPGRLRKEDIRGNGRHHRTARPRHHFVFLVTERIWPARTFPPRKGWQRIGLGFTGLVASARSPKRGQASCSAQSRR